MKEREKKARQRSKKASRVASRNRQTKCREKQASQTSTTTTQATKGQKKPSMSKAFSAPTLSVALEDKLLGFEHDHEAAIVMHHLNSGHEKFPHLESLLKKASTSGNKAIDVTEKAKEELLKQRLEINDLTPLVEEFLTASGRTAKDKTRKKGGLTPSVDAHHIVCGACGMRNVDGEHGKWSEEFMLEKLPHFMQLTPEQEASWRHERANPITVPTDCSGGTKQIDVSKVWSIHHSQKLGKCFHLHPEFVHVRQGKERTFLCHSCSAHIKKKKKEAPTKTEVLEDNAIADHGTVETVHDPTPPKPNHADAIELFPQHIFHCSANPEAPPFSIASGLDFGDHRRVGLPVPTMMEHMIISKVRHFHNVMKVQSNHRSSHRSDGTMNELKAHSIMFRDDTATLASLTLDADFITESVTSALTLELVGPNGEVDKLLDNSQLNRVLSGRPHVVFQWLAVLQRTHPLYKLDPPLIWGDLLALEKALKAAQSSIFSGAVMVTDTETVNEDRIHGDDTSGIRTKILSQVDLDEIKASPRHGETGISMTHSLITNSMDLCRPRQAHAAQDATPEEVLQQKQAIAKERAMSCLRSVAEVMNVELPQREEENGEHGERDPIPAQRSTIPLNTYEEMQELLTGAFPTIFMLGKTYDRKSLLLPCQVEHLLFQHTNIPAESKELQFDLFDCKSIHTVIKTSPQK